MANAYPLNKNQDFLKLLSTINNIDCITTNKDVMLKLIDKKPLMLNLVSPILLNNHNLIL